eukprot:CAMPEP_0168527306 /NCGR_PEP_ID=MMETSP0405-20121227/12523_1 /TAXON_ID=498012 /ORGANISM="Trichosphaerium sp, Strain Am-I-7 wt" /LENGTH=227 /DNA_ID=CAMNT_0008550391 /DNA_START=17 /DNA_END=700 /DNA_ORIENTATION=-
MGGKKSKKKDTSSPSSGGIDFSFRTIVVGAKGSGKLQFPIPEDDEKMGEEPRRDLEKLEWEEFKPPHLQDAMKYPRFEVTKGSLARVVDNVTPRRRKVKLDLICIHRIRLGGGDATKDKNKHPFEYQSSYFRGVIFMYDMNDTSSFQEAEIWIKDMANFAPFNVCGVLVAGKFDDVTGKRMVTKEQGENLASKYRMPYFETSCKTSKGVDEAFRACATMMVKTVEPE